MLGHLFSQWRDSLRVAVSLDVGEDVCLGQAETAAAIIGYLPMDCLIKLGGSEVLGFHFPAGEGAIAPSIHSPVGMGWIVGRSPLWILNDLSVCLQYGFHDLTGCLDGLGFEVDQEVAVGLDDRPC